MKKKYRKPIVIAKSAPKRSFAAGCPVKAALGYCTQLNHACEAGSLK